MNDLCTDSRGRRHRYQPQSTGKRVTPQKRDLLWFAFLARHGPLPSSYLHQLTKAEWTSEKRAKERLTDLFNEAETPHGGPYLTRPLQQFRTIDSRYNELVYDLKPASWFALSEQTETTDSECRASGPWLHAHMTACITASIELAAKEHGLRYISAHQILTRADTQLRYPVDLPAPYGRIDLIPDALFGLQYPTEAGPRFRFFVIEADRATEPFKSSNAARKSALRSFLQYAAYIEAGRYKAHLRLTAPLLVLNVTTSPERQERQMALLQQRVPSGCGYQLFTHWEAFADPWRPCGPRFQLLLDYWERAGMGEVFIRGA